MVTVSDEDRWASVEQLLHDETIRLNVRIAGLFTLLFAQPLTSICRMHTGQVDTTDDDQVLVAFDREPIEMPPVLADLVGITPDTAMRWAALTSRSWSAYIAQR